MPGMRTGLNLQVPDSININNSNYFRQDTFSGSEYIMPLKSGDLQNVSKNTALPVPDREADSVKTVDVYTSDTTWNSDANFLSRNPLTNVLPPSSHDVLYGVTVQEKTVNGMGAIPQERKKPGEDWLTGLLFIVVVLFVWIRVFYGKYYSQLTDSLLNYQISTKLYYEKSVLSRRVSFILDIIYLLVMAIFLYEINAVYGILVPGKSNMYYLFIIFTILAVYSVSRLAVLRITGFIFDIQPLFSSFIHHMSIFNKGLGIILFPLSLALLFIPASMVKFVLMTGIAVFIIIMGLKLVRSLKIIMWKDVSLFYLILYLCTLEILPLLLGYKLMKSVILSY